jgi:hypothetical protein
MPLTDPVSSQVVSPRQEVSRPASITSRWTTIISGGGPAVQDAATITNPTTQIINATSRICRRGNEGTVIMLRLGYDDAVTLPTSPVVKVFGRTGTDEWQLLSNEANAITSTLTLNLTTDTTDGAFKYTFADSIATTIDCLGCEELLVGIEVAFAATGVVNNSFIQAKIV